MTSNTRITDLLVIVLLSFAALHVTLSDVTSAATGSARPRRSIRAHKLPPVLLLPGNSGSQLEVRVDRPPGGGSVPGCADQRDWFRAWMNIYEMLPGTLTS